MQPSTLNPEPQTIKQRYRKHDRHDRARPSASGSALTGMQPGGVHEREGREEQPPDVHCPGRCRQIPLLRLGVVFTHESVLDTHKSVHGNQCWAHMNLC